MNIRHLTPTVLESAMERTLRDARPPDTPAHEGDEQPGWSYPETSISRSEGFCKVRLYVPGLESKSVMVEVGENLAVLSGLRWDRNQEADRARLSPFRRLVELPGPVCEDGWRISCDGNVLFLHLLPAGEARA